MSEDEFNDKLINTVIDNFNMICENSNIEKKYNFDEIKEVFDNIISKILVIKNKQDIEYQNTKKSFSKLLNCNYKFICENINLDIKILETFEDSSNNNWNLLFITIISILSFTKNINDNQNINYKGMIDKLMNKIIETNDFSDTEKESKNIEIINENNSQSVVKNLLSDIKTMIKSDNISNSKDLLNMSKNISSKYQNMIESGSINPTELIGSLLGLLKNPNSLNEEFKDINISNLPDPNSLLEEIAEDSNLKNAMKTMLGNNNDLMSNFMNNNNENIIGSLGSSLMSNFMDNNINNSTNIPKSSNELDKEIERLLKEVNEKE